MDMREFVKFCARPNYRACRALRWRNVAITFEITIHAINKNAATMGYEPGKIDGSVHISSMQRTAPVMIANAAAYAAKCEGAWLASVAGAAAQDAAATKPDTVAMHGAKSIAIIQNCSASNGLVENSCATITPTPATKNTRFIKKNAYKKTTLDSSTKSTTTTRMRRIALAFCSEPIPFISNPLVARRSPRNKRISRWTVRFGNCAGATLHGVNF